LFLLSRLREGDERKKKGEKKGRVLHIEVENWKEREKEGE